MAKKSNVNITERTTKQGLVKFLSNAVIEGKDLGQRVKYALDMFTKDMTKVTKKDLWELAQEVLATMTSTPAPVEASLKPKGLKKAEKEEVQDEEEEQEVEKPKAKSTSKAKPKKGKAKEQEVETLPPVSNAGVDNLPSAKIFPAEIDHEELGKLVSCAGHYKTYAEVLKALEEDKTLYFACYWSKRHIKSYSYADSFGVAVPKNGFPFDLDIVMAVLPCETIERVFAMSRITEALYRFEGEDFAPLEDVDPRSGDKFQIRVSAGMEFEIYRPADEDIVK